METALIVSVAAWFIGAFICGLCGLGVAIIAIPFMIWVLPVQEVVLISCLTLLGMMVGMALYYVRYCSWKIVLWMALGTIPGSLVGILILRRVSSSLLELIIGVLLIFCIVGLQAFQDRIKIVPRVRYSLGAGVLGGIIGTCATIDGPVVGLYGLLSGWNPQQFLGITSVYFFLRSLVTCTVQWYSGLYTETIVTYSLWCIAASLIGFFLSIPLLKHINVSTFRTIVKVIILFSGIMCLVKAFI